jgi:hypothetical protein
MTPLKSYDTFQEGRLGCLLPPVPSKKLSTPVPDDFLPATPNQTIQPTAISESVRQIAKACGKNILANMFTF